jgi:hypothetical protein
MCRTYNQYTHDGKDMDIFDARFSSFKRKVSDFIKAKWSWDHDVSVCFFSSVLLGFFFIIIIFIINFIY